MSGSNLSIASVALVFGPIAKSTIASAAAVAFGSWSFVGFVATSSIRTCFASSAIWPTCSTCAVGRPSSIVVSAAVAVATVAIDGFVVVAAFVVAAEIACRFGSSSCGPCRWICAWSSTSSSMRSLSCSSCSAGRCFASGSIVVVGTVAGDVGSSSSRCCCCTLLGFPELWGFYVGFFFHGIGNSFFFDGCGEKSSMFLFDF